MTAYVQRQRPGRDLFVVGLVGTLGLLGGVLSASGRLAVLHRRRVREAPASAYPALRQFFDASQRALGQAIAFRRVR